MESKVNNFSTLLNITKENTKCRNFFVYEKYENNSESIPYSSHFSFIDNENTQWSANETVE